VGVTPENQHTSRTRYAWSLKPTVAAILPLDRAKQALELGRTRHVTRKIVTRRTDRKTCTSFFAPHRGGFKSSAAFHRVLARRSDR